MVMVYLAGLGVVCGHHFFYSRLSRKPPPAAVYRVWNSSMALTGQQLNLAIGAALAFLVKSTLSAVVSVSAEQSAWRAIRTSTMTVGGIDKLLLMRRDFLCLCSFEPWKKSLLGVLLTVLYWYAQDFVLPCFSNQ